MCDIEERDTYDGWVADTPEKANWAVRRIKEERARLEVFVQAANAEISRLLERIAAQTERYETRNSALLAKLDAYLDSVPAKESKTQRSLELPGGKLVRKLAKADYTYDEATLLAYLQANAPEFVQQLAKPKWGEFKKTLTIQDGTVVITETGELVDAVGVIEKPSVMEVV